MSTLSATLKTARWPTIALWVLTILVALVSLRYLLQPIEIANPGMAHHQANRPIALFSHIVPAIIALALLPLQFSHRLRKAWLGLHRWVGRLYGLSILIGGVAGFSLALNTDAGTFAATGFALLAVFWIGTTAYAVYLAMQKRIAEHRRWMIRSAALTLAAVSLRIELPILIALFGFETGYPMVAWLCWVPNLLIAEWLLRPTTTAQPA